MPRVGLAAPRFAWFHPEKTGTSLGNSLVHIANPQLPANVSILSSCGPRGQRRPCRGTTDRFGQDRYTYARWFPGVFWEKGGDFAKHVAVDDSVFAKWAGSFVGLFRDPARRAVSAYYHKYTGFCRSQQATRGASATCMTLTPYARFIEGQVATLLACKVGRDPATGRRYRRTNLFWCKRPHADALNVALKRLASFSFVGLTDEFDVSVCLLHVMHRAPCRPVELTNERPTDYRQRARAHGEAFQSVDELAQALREKYVDPLDTPLYNMAVRRFEADIREHNVTQSACAQLRCATSATTRYFDSRERLLSGK
ncbi:hypothetical protein KFE25_004675 [Diacronema lutheri]|uniref:Sulfotransferase n=1 Tax=Diacronema lutheri TaxID=2081491 RepID=A0A8J6C7E4_DIALT|nr:hypothetical protein KFE25_004675 [Diacronema lutheri]